MRIDEFAMYLLNPFLLPLDLSALLRNFMFLLTRRKCFPFFLDVIYIFCNS